MTDKLNLNDLLIQQLVSVESVSLNVSQSYILITEDKLRLSLQEHTSKLGKTRDWIAPFSLEVSLILVLVTADFKNLGFPAETWSAIFVIAAVITGFWLLFSLRFAFKFISLDMLIEEIRSDNRLRSESFDSSTEIIGPGKGIGLDKTRESNQNE